MMNQKVFLIKFDAYWSNYIPYSLIYLSNILRKEDIQTEILHNIWENEAKQDLINFAKKIKKINPFLVAFSVITGRSIKYSLILSKAIKKINKNIKIAWGGIHPSILPELTLSSEFIDYVVSGEGEIRIKKLLDFIDGRSRTDLDGISYKEDGKLVINPPVKVVNNIDKWTDLDWDDYDLRRYVNYDLGKPKLSYLTSRGCPYNCGFCVNETLGRNKYYNTKSIDHIVSDIEYLKKKYKIKHIHINDDNFFVNKSRAFEILQKIKLGYFAEARINYINELFCKKLKYTNCKLLMCGAESGNNRILKYIRKGLKKKQLFSAARLIGKYNLHSSWSFILGFPTETKEEMRESFDAMRKIDILAKKRICKPGIFIPYPGCFLYDEAIKYGAILPKNLIEWANFERYTYAKCINSFDYKYYIRLRNKYFLGSLDGFIDKLKLRMHQIYLKDSIQRIIEKLKTTTPMALNKLFSLMKNN